MMAQIFLVGKFKKIKEQFKVRSKRQLLQFLKVKKIIIYGSGRTDSGVHSLGQIAHFDIDTNLDIFKIQ